MTVKYDRAQDILYISFSDGAIHESDEEKKGIIPDYTADGQIAGIEVLNTSKRVGRVDGRLGVGRQSPKHI